MDIFKLYLKSKYLFLNKFFGFWKERNFFDDNKAIYIELIYKKQNITLLLTAIIVYIDFKKF